DERQDHVALAHVILDPLLVDRDVAFQEVEARVRHEVADALGRHVHAVDVPVRVGEDALREVVADEAIHAEDAESFHRGRDPRVRSRVGGKASYPSRAASRTCRRPPSAQSTWTGPSSTWRRAGPGAPAPGRRRVRWIARRWPCSSVNAPG